METKATVITPGGRVGNDRSTGSRSNGENWVERTASGHLPRYIRIVRNGLMKDGHPEGQATALAVAAMKRWAHGGDNVSPKVQAAAAAALAEWEAMRAEKSDGDDLEIADVSDVEFKDQFPANLLSELHDDLDNAVEVKEATMQLETKQAPGVTGLKIVDETKGIVEAFVSVTNVRDKVGDIIQPGAYTKTLQARKPKGVYAHDWKMPVSKALEVKELLPGHPDLPQHLKDIGAGALKVKMQFNLDTERGRDAYSDVIFYKDEQEWSVGYQVPGGAARMDTKTGTRNIDMMDLYEYSPVLFGAAPHTSTASVKDLLGFKDALVTEDVMHMSDIRFKELCDAVGIEFGGSVQSDQGESPE
jgi:HK97 family phage prohead protease